MRNDEYSADVEIDENGKLVGVEGLSSEWTFHLPFGPWSNLLPKK